MKNPALKINGLFSIFSKLILAIFALFIFAFVVSQNANAEIYITTTDNNSYTEIEQSNISSDVPMSVHNGMQILMIEMLSTVHCQLIGTDPINKNAKCLGVDPDTGKIGFVENGGGAISFMGKLIDSTLIPPASSMQYLAYLQNNFGVAKTALAQNQNVNLVGTSRCNDDTNGARGVGFCTIEFLLPIWETMRNIVYLLFVIIFIIIGIGIMLRLHIDPRTIMTIQNQIPKIIIGIITITFSFAIAGFLIDIMWIATYLFASVIVFASDGSVAFAEITQATNPFSAANYIWPDSTWGIPEVATSTGTAFSDIIEGTLENLFGDTILDDILGGVIDVLATIIVFIAILVALFRLWVKLILALVSVILDIILAPWWIIAGLIPGSNLGVGVWIRDLVANLAVFPVAVAFLLLGSLIMYSLVSTNSASTIYFPLMGGTNAKALAVIIGFGFLMFIPTLTDSLKDLLKAPKGGFGNIFGPVGAGAGFVAGTAGRTFGGVKSFQQARTVTGMPEFDSDGKLVRVPEGRVSPTKAARKMLTGNFGGKTGK